MTGVAGTVDGGQGGLPGRGEVCTAKGRNIESFTSPRAPPHPSLPPPQVNTVLDLESNPHLGFALLPNACKSIF